MTYPSAPRLALADPARLEELRAERGNPIDWRPHGFFFRISRSERESAGGLSENIRERRPARQTPAGGDGVRLREHKRRPGGSGGLPD